MEEEVLSLSEFLDEVTQKEKSLGFFDDMFGAEVPFDCIVDAGAKTSEWGSDGYGVAFEDNGGFEVWLVPEVDDRFVSLGWIEPHIIVCVPNNCLINLFMWVG